MGMLTRFSVANYKNFKEPIEWILDRPGKYQHNSNCLIQKVVGKAILYGKNGTGKSNLGKAMLDVKNVLLADQAENGFDFGQLFLHSDSDQPFAQFRYGFRIGSAEIEYSYQKNCRQQLAAEKLTVNKQLVFNLNFSDPALNEIKNLKLIGLKTLSADHYFSRLNSEDEEPISFLRWAYNNSQTSDLALVDQLMDEVKGMYYLAPNQAIDAINSDLRNPREMTNDKIERLEAFLKDMGFSCKLLLRQELDARQRLYFDLQTPILFFENASSGLKTLAQFYLQLDPILAHATLVYIDEFDAFFHYETAERFFSYFKLKYPDIQFIFTAHHPDLISNHLLRPDCCFLLSSKGTITSLDRATGRELREGHNLEKMYRSGEFLEYE